LRALLGGCLARAARPLRHSAARTHGRDVHGLHERHLDRFENPLAHPVHCHGDRSTGAPRAQWRGGPVSAYQGDSLVKLAVFTSHYPAQVATFFERDMRSLLEAGVEIDVYAVA